MKEESLIKISASSVKTFDQCPKKYWFQYINKAPKKEWPHLVLGNICHKTLEIFHKKYLIKKVSNDKLGSLMKESFVDALKEFQNAEKKIIDEAFLLLRDYLESIKKTSMPNVKGVETPFEFEIDTGILIRGFIDRIDDIGCGKIRISDYKTSKNPKYLDSFQLNIYGLWLRKENPNIKNFSGSYILLKHKSITKDYEFNSFDLDKIQKSLISYANKIKTETEWNFSPSPLCDFCDFKQLCDSQKDW